MKTAWSCCQQSDWFWKSRICFTIARCTSFLVRHVYSGCRVHPASYELAKGGRAAKCNSNNSHTSNAQTNIPQMVTSTTTLRFMMCCIYMGNFVLARATGGHKQHSSSTASCRTSSTHRFLLRVVSDQSLGGWLTHTCKPISFTGWSSTCEPNNEAAFQLHRYFRNHFPSVVAMPLNCWFGWRHNRCLQM
jgi:hypothetical protein